MPILNDRSELVFFMRRWLSANPHWAWDSSNWPGRSRRSADEIALGILQAMEQEDVYLAQWFQSPDGQLIVRAAGEALSPWASADIHLFVDAVTLAAEARNKNQKVAATMLAVALIAAVMFTYGLAKGLAT